MYSTQLISALALVALTLASPLARRDDNTDPTFIKTALDLHNAVRAHTNSTGVVPMLSWDPALATEAQQWAEQTCKKFVSNENLGSKVEQNIYSAHPGRLAGLGKAIEAWANSMEDYYTNPQAYSDMSYGSYMRVVWKAATRVGCGAIQCPGGRRDNVVCEYADEDIRIFKSSQTRAAAKANVLPWTA